MGCIANLFYLKAILIISLMHLAPMCVATKVLDLFTLRIYSL